MANKNTRKLRNAIRAAGKKGKDTVAHKKPLYNYHNIPNDKYRSNPDSCFTTQEFPTARMGKNGVVSSNARRNTVQRVYQNQVEGFGTDSITRHEPLKRGNPMRHKNHKYLTGHYRQPSLRTPSALPTELVESSVNDSQAAVVAA